MKLYSATISLGGNVLNQVYKEGLTTKEVKILQILHGSGSVGNIREMAPDESYTRAQEREMLLYTYLRSLDREHTQDVRDAIQRVIGYAEDELTDFNTVEAPPAEDKGSRAIQTEAPPRPKITLPKLPADARVVKVA